MLPPVPEFRLDVDRVPGEKYPWRVMLLRQEKKYARWVLLSTAQGKALSEALGAAQHGCRNQELQHPELW